MKVYLSTKDMDNFHPLCLLFSGHPIGTRTDHSLYPKRKDHSLCVFYTGSGVGHCYCTFIN